MPRAARKRITAGAGPPRYNPLAARPPVAHKRDTRLARRQRPTLQSLPRDVLAIILSMVPWGTARGVCRRWAELRPMPRRCYLAYEAGKTLTRVARAVLTRARELIDSDSQQMKDFAPEVYAHAYDQVCKSLAVDVHTYTDLRKLVDRVIINFMRPSSSVPLRTCRFSCWQLVLFFNNDLVLYDDGRWSGLIARLAQLDDTDAKIFAALRPSAWPYTLYSSFEELLLSYDVHWPDEPLFVDRRAEAVAFFDTVAAALKERPTWSARPYVKPI